MRHINSFLISVPRIRSERGQPTSVQPFNGMAGMDPPNFRQRTSVTCVSAKPPFAFLWGSSLFERSFSQHQSSRPIPIQERDDLGAGHCGIGAESSSTGPAGDSVLRGPQYRVMIICTLRHIRERILRGCGCRGTGRPPQEGHHLGAGVGLAGSKQCLRNSGSDAVFHCPQHGIVIIGALSFDTSDPVSKEARNITRNVTGYALS